MDEFFNLNTRNEVLLKAVDLINERQFEVAERLLIT